LPLHAYRLAGDSGDGEAYSVEREFEDVAAVVRKAWDRVALFGHSYGGLVSAGAAGRLEGLERLVLYEPPMGGVLADEIWQERFQAHLAAGDPDAAVRLFLHDVGGYSHVEIDVMEGTPAWQQRLAAAPGVSREFAPSGSYRPAASRSTAWTSPACCSWGLRARPGRAAPRRPSPRPFRAPRCAPCTATATVPRSARRHCWRPSSSGSCSSRPRD
jgi:pimeloyl-ACP methyl ester carboxylesterase